MKLPINATHLFLIVISLISWWLVKLSDTHETPIINNPQHSPDYIAQDYYKWTLNEQGQLKEYLAADSISHYSDDGITQLNKPQLLSFPVETTSNKAVKKRAKKATALTPKLYNSTPWFIKAKQGVLSASGTELALNDAVFINRVNTKGNAPLTINTSNLKIDLSKQFAETKAWAELISPPQKTTGVGLQVDFLEPIKVRLLTRVKGHYEVN